MIASALLLFRSWKFLLALAAISALVAGYFYWQDHQRYIGAIKERAVWESKIITQKLEAQTMLNDERQKTEDAEAKLTEARTTQETKDATNAKTIKSLSAELGYIKRLRDPYAQSGCGCSGGGAEGKDTASASAGAGDGAPSGGLLSPELTAFLFDQARSADEINIAYASCRQDAMNVRELMK